MAEYCPVGTIVDFPDPSSSLVEVDEEAIVLIHAAGKFYALDDVCTHDGGPLSAGPLDINAEELSIICPRHGAHFSVATGAALTMPATQATRSHEVITKGDQVLIRLTN